MMLDGDNVFVRPVHSSAKELCLIGGTCDLTRDQTSPHLILLNVKFLELQLISLVVDSSQQSPNIQQTLSL